jgi:hypothetical protein
MNINNSGVEEDVRFVFSCLKILKVQDPALLGISLPKSCM